MPTGRITVPWRKGFVQDRGWRPSTAAAVGLALALVGCGSGSSDRSGSGSLTLDGVVSCLQSKAAASGARVSTNVDDLDLIAEHAGVGGIQLLWPRNEANIAMERTSDDAKRTEKQYELFASAAGGVLIDRRGTVVASYTM